MVNKGWESGTTHEANTLVPVLASVRGQHFGFKVVEEVGEGADLVSEPGEFRGRARLPVVFGVDWGGHGAKDGLD